MPTPNSRRQVQLFAALFLLLVQLTDGQGSQDTTAAQGVLVEDVGRNSAGEAAGIRPGDVLLSWTRAAIPSLSVPEAKGDLRSPFDLAEVELEEAPRGTVTLAGSRNGQKFSATLAPGDWKISIRPQMSDALLVGYEDGRRRIAANDTEAGTKIWRDVAVKADEAMVRCWISVRTADVLASAQRWAQADAAYREVIELGTRLDRPTVLATLWEKKGAAFQRRNQASDAEAAYRQALQLREQRSPVSLGAAHDLHVLGGLAKSRGDQQSAGRLHQRALEIRTQLAPDSLQLAASLTELGVLAAEREDNEPAEEFFIRSVRIRERLAPASLELANSLHALGIVIRRRGDLAAAEALYRRALTIKEKLAPESLSLSLTLNNLGIVARDRGDLAAAEDFYRRALTIQEKLAPDGLQIATIVRNLAGVARERGDLALAQDLAQRALARYEKRGQDSLEVAAALSDLGVIALDRDDKQAALAFHTRALALRTRLAPDSLVVANTMNNLGEVARLTGDLPRAKELHASALRIREKIAPGRLDVAASLSNLARVAEDQREPQTAEGLYARALPLYKALAPGSAGEARTYYRLGVISRGATRPVDAARYFGLAIDALESQVGRLGGAEEIRSGFAAERVSYYREYAEVLAGLDQTSRAFDVVERSRARSLLAMLAERDLSFASDVSPEFERERKRVATEYDRTQSAMAGLDPAKDSSELTRLRLRLNELRDQREANARRARQASPRFAALRYPQPLDAAGTRRALDPGTVLLSYSVGEHRTILFVVQPPQRLVASAPGVSVFTIPVGADALREQVKAFRNLIQRRSGSGENAIAALRTQGRTLFETLVKPAEQLIAGASRVVISPDDVLHTLPFGALVLPPRASRAETSRYFIEWKPLHNVISGTVYAELKKTRRTTSASARPTVVAFADPSYGSADGKGTDAAIDPGLRALVRSGYTFEPLPASRAEVSGIVKLYGDSAVSYIGPAATEERAKSIGRSPRYVHFATHGVLDEELPLNSGLVLSLRNKPAEGQDNGLLQAWEIFEQVLLDADLVTLSACESALGKELGGEGLVSLTRAFQYAGARSVMASLWSVADESTADLMTRFYGYLKTGKTKDAALRAAQLDLIRSTRGKESNLSHPFHWAAFTLNGDWR